MAEKNFAEPRAELAVGTRHAGFTVTSVEPITELSGCAYVMPASPSPPSSRSPSSPAAPTSCATTPRELAPCGWRVPT